jgi:DnaJ family protein C protein 28
MQRVRVYQVMDKRESLIDKMIRESMERGEFDDLPGRGQPVDLSENPFEDPDLRTVHRLLRNAGFAPAWMEERKDIAAEFERAWATLVRAKKLFGQSGKLPTQSEPGGDRSLAESAQWQRAAKEFSEIVAVLNHRIRIYNLKAPAVVFHRKTIDAESLIRDLEND